MVAGSMPGWKPHPPNDPAAEPLEIAWASLAFLVPTIVSLFSKMGAIDLAYHLRAGEEVLSGHIPRVDTYTFSVPGTPWLDQQWAAQGVFAAIYRAGGWPMLEAAQALLVGITFFLVYLAARNAGARVRTASLLTLGGFLVASPGLGMRPQLLALPLFAALLWVTAGREAHPGRLWLAPVFAAMAANLHGSFTLFPLVLGLAWLEDRRTRSPQAPPHAPHHGRDRSGDDREPLRLARMDLRLRALEQSGDPQDDHRVGADDDRDGPGLVRDRFGVGGRRLPRAPNATDPMDIAAHPRRVLPARAFRAARDRVVGHGHAGRARGAAPTR